VAKVELNYGEIHIVLETKDDALVVEFEQVLNLVRDKFKGKSPMSAKPAKKEVLKPEGKDKTDESGERPADQVSFGKHLTKYVKLSKPEVLLAFANWYGKPFKSKDFFAVEKERGTLTKSLHKGFHPRLTGLRKAGKIEIASKGLYKITNKGKQSLERKRK